MSELTLVQPKTIRVFFNRGAAVDFKYETRKAALTAVDHFLGHVAIDSCAEVCSDGSIGTVYLRDGDRPCP